MKIEEDKIKKLFGKKIRELRKTKHLTQEQLAEMVELDTHHLCKIENGMHFPSLKSIIKLSSILEADFVDLFNFDHSKGKKTINWLTYTIQHKLNNKELNFLEQIVKSLLDMNKQ